MSAIPDANAPSREESVFNAALALPPAQRAAFLDRTCAADGALRARVDALLRSYGESEGFMETNTAAGPHGTIVAAGSEGPGDVIGRYKIREKLGEGGCGMVYVAEQTEPVRRRVALKVIKLGMDTRSVIARFDAERQALAMMDHPNIAKVLDAGTTDKGRPYFVMELVRGIKITEYCDQHNLDTEERIRLFVQVCHAVQHAHQKGIIHRDIKPSNILVTLHDGVPVPKVIDFGIAKATEGRLTDQTIYTQLFEFIGTPAYISPEQAEMSGLDIDTRSDIYSLGVLLYELLTGKTPFDSQELLDSGLDGMRRTIREREPVAPSTRLSSMGATDLTETAHRHRAEPPRLVHFIQGDLDWIVMKALEKDRTRRFETASAMAMDLQRFLTNEPVEARPPNNWYRLQKMARRNKAVFAAAAGIVAALALGFGVSLHLYVKEKAAEKEQARLRQLAEAGLEFERTQRQHAEIGMQLWRAGVLMSQDQFDQAEALVKEVPPIPQRAALDNVLGMVRARYGKFPAAISNYIKSTQAQPTNDTGVHCLLPLLAHEGKTNEFDEWRLKALDQFQSTGDADVAERLGLDCLILPANEAEMGRIEKMLETVKSPNQPLAELARGLVEYRHGQFAAAAARLEKVVDHQPNGNAEQQARLILAMAQTKAGATVHLDPPNPTLTGPDWNEKMTTQLLANEARTVLGR
ncbi:MAG TPA: protein kinase [Verrucomicrobiae bacterium]|jgi:serine/threonine protein kinase/Tfp pilus assembly protein PilF|nr:protein kinase [Verrucomicrobiae bacterium]